MRKFPAHQLSETENELASLAFHADHMSLDIGEFSDRIHWDGDEPIGAQHWIDEVVRLRGKLDRAEGLLRAYELVRKAKIGESNDYASAR